MRNKLLHVLLFWIRGAINMDTRKHNSVITAIIDWGLLHLWSAICVVFTTKHILIF